MKISEIKNQKRNRNRVSIYIDGRYAFSLGSDTFMRSDIHVGDEIEEKQIERLVKKDEFSRARDYAYTLISYRDRSEYEIRQRLLEKGFHQEVVREVFDSLKAQRLIDDKSFAGRWVENVLTSKPMGKMRVAYELKKKRIREEIILEACDERFTPGTELRLARRAAEKRMNSLKGYPSDIKRRRLFRYLKNRGFDFEIIGEIMKELSDDCIQ